ncbi:hypothetical protein PMAYCL1PPCAC_13705, partial [Pristionchus mayeri]
AMRLYSKIPHGSMTSDDWQSWPASGSSPQAARSSPEVPKEREELGADSAHFANQAHFGPTTPTSSSSSEEDGRSSSATRFSDEESGEARMGARSRGGVGGCVNGQWEVGKLVFIVVFLALAGLSNWAVLAYTHDFVGREPLPDIVFTLVPEIIVAAKLGDILVSVCLSCMAILLVFHQSRFTIIRRVFFIAATLYSMRSVTLLATQLPPGYSDNVKRCRERSTNFSLGRFLERWGEQTVRLGFQVLSDLCTLGEEGMLCGDMLFSGHTLVMMVSLLTVTHYLPTKWRLLRFFPYCFAYIGMTCMIVSRTHYTIDVVVAHWLTTLIFASYHAYAESDLFMDRKQSVLHNYAYFKVVAWLEENIVPGKLENEFVNPVKQLRAWYGAEPRDVGNGHHKQVSVSSSSTFGMPSTA